MQLLLLQLHTYARISLLAAPADDLGLSSADSAAVITIFEGGDALVADQRVVTGMKVERHGVVWEAAAADSRISPLR